AATTSPVPRLVAVIGANFPPGSRTSPDTSANSTTAISPRRAYAVHTGSPVGPDAVTRTAPKPAANAAATGPSPPSAIGTTDTSAPGRTRWIPERTAAPTCAAVNDPLNLSDAIRTRVMSRSVRFRGRGRDVGRGLCQFFEFDDIVDLESHRHIR